jgi:DNA-directed RNA polymerase subunit RPC12/RpoP
LEKIWVPSLFDNAVASIRMGVEDFQQKNPDRDISAVRNFYAGVLLLAKEALIRSAPDADPALVIGAKLKPVPNDEGGIEMKQVGHATIDFQQISDRAKDFGVQIDHKALKALNTIRNDMEHHYTDEPATAIRAAVSKGFPIVASLFRQMDVIPIEVLGDAWAAMLEAKELYDEELREARATLEKVTWYSPNLHGASLQCIKCTSELVEQADPENEIQENIELRCRTCGDTPQTGDMIEHVIDKIYGGDAYIRAKDGGGDGPIYTCPACDRHSLVEDEDGCANCGEVLDYQAECARCGEEIPIQDYLDGLDGGLCSYCAWRADKVMRDD